MASRGLTAPIVWLTTPLALPLVADLEPCAVVYDCMDDVVSPRVASPELAARDKALMALADIGRDPAALPRRPNLRWAGLQRYEALPRLMSHWDACLLPFVVDETTRLLSPPQTLEYLAGGKPVVGTPIRDLVSLHGDVVRIADDAEGFVAAVDDLLAEAVPARAERRARGQGLVEPAAIPLPRERVEQPSPALPM